MKSWRQSLSLTGEGDSGGLLSLGPAGLGTAQDRAPVGWGLA